LKIESKGHTVTFEGDDWEDIVDIAGYGINYWCSRAVVNDLNYSYTVTEAETGDVYTIWKVQMEEVYGEILDGEYSIAPYIREYFRSGDVGDIDATAGDVLVQICCFGKIVYG
jgi:hypothetical protein